jgi:putative membrane protein
LMGFGFVVARFGLFLRELGAASLDVAVRSSGFSLAVGIVMVLLGVVVNIVAPLQYLKTIRGLNAGIEVTGKPSVTGVALAGLLATAGLVLAVYLVVFR